jgi:hypothetical protein
MRQWQHYVPTVLLRHFRMNIADRCPCRVLPLSLLSSHRRTITFAQDFVHADNYIIMGP